MAWTVIFQINVRNCIGLNIKLLTDNIGFCIQMKNPLSHKMMKETGFLFYPSLICLCWKKDKTPSGQAFCFLWVSTNKSPQMWLRQNQEKTICLENETWDGRDALRPPFLSAVCHVVCHSILTSCDIIRHEVYFLKVI